MDARTRKRLDEEYRKNPPGDLTNPEVCRKIAEENMKAIDEMNRLKPNKISIVAFG